MLNRKAQHAHNSFNCKYKEVNTNWGKEEEIVRQARHDHILGQQDQIDQTKTGTTLDNTYIRRKKTLQMKYKWSHLLLKFIIMRIPLTNVTMLPWYGLSKLLGDYTTF